MERNGGEGRPPCPRCGTGRVVPIRYGYPRFTEDLERDLRAGLFVLGGCFPKPETWQCVSCGAKYLDEARPPLGDGSGFPGSRGEA